MRRCLWVCLVAGLISSGLAGCASRAEVQAANEERIAVYENQLVSDPTVSYATVRALPLPADAINPFVVEAVDGRKLEDLSFNLNISGFRDIYQSHARVKIPAGSRDLLIRGGGWRRVLHTRFPQVNLQAGQDYLIVYSTVGREVYIHLATYETDPRFKETDSDQYVPLVPLTERIKVGAL